MPMKKSPNKKALLAIAFAGGVLIAPPPAHSDPDAVLSGAAIENLASSAKIPSKVRAFYLLSLANSYLMGTNRYTLEAQFERVADELAVGRSHEIRNADAHLVSWCERLSLPSTAPQAMTAAAKHNQVTATIPHENSVLANKALFAALGQIDLTSEIFEKFNMYYIATRLFQKNGNTVGAEKCSKILQEFVHSTESNKTANYEQIRAAASILNLMAYGLVPVDIPDLIQQNSLKNQPPVSPSITEKDFTQSENLKLRAVALVDCLSHENDLRRKTHRNLSLWYAQLGKNSKAEKEKQILFELVGCHDDIILYAQPGTCGHLVWWQKVTVKNDMSCGMG